MSNYRVAYDEFKEVQKVFKAQQKDAKIKIRKLEQKRKKLDKQDTKLWNRIQRLRYKFAIPSED